MLGCVEIPVPRLKVVVPIGLVRVNAGELELGNTNGAIEALDIKGSVVAHTTNGDVRVTFDRITPDKAMSFVTFHGDVDITFPAGFRADLRIAASRGDIFTDFEFESTPSDPAVKATREGGRLRVVMTDEVRATIGGGGPDMHFKTWSGDVLIRKR